MVLPVYRYGYWGQLFRPLPDSGSADVQNIVSSEGVRNPNPIGAPRRRSSNGRSRLEGRVMDERHLEMAEQFQEEQLIRAIEKARSELTEPTGICLNCEEKLEGTRRFCNAECREDYESRSKVLRKQYA